MAYIEKLKSGKWRAQIRRKSLSSLSRTFERKADAVAWARDIESDLYHGNYKLDTGITVEQIFRAYVAEKITGQEEKKRADLIRINKYLDELDFMTLKASELVAKHIQDFIDLRLESVTESSVKREYGVVRAVLRFGAKKLDAPVDLSIFDKVKVPKEHAPRNRNVAPEEIQRIWDLCKGPVGRTARSYVPAVFEFCCETAMRKGEALALKHSDIHEQDGLWWAVLHTSKNGSGRVVPLSPQAVEIYKMVPGKDDDPVFDIRSGTLDTTFRKVVREAGIVDLHFHDSRHQATLTLAKKLSVLDLAKVTGHKSTSILLNVYYQPSGADLARALSTPSDA